MEGRSVLVTGASKGIGRAAARAFAAEGCNLELAARSGEALAALKDEVAQAHGVRVRIHVTDLAASDAHAASR